MMSGKNLMDHYIIYVSIHIEENIKKYFGTRFITLNKPLSLIDSLLRYGFALKR